MCSHYEAVPDPRVLKEVFQVEPTTRLGKLDLWPGYEGRALVNLEVTQERMGP